MYSQESVLRSKIAYLYEEHRDLDQAIERISTHHPGDELLIRRLKKRKLALKDRIAQLEQLLTPDEPA